MSYFYASLSDMEGQTVWVNSHEGGCDEIGIYYFDTNGVLRKQITPKDNLKFCQKDENICCKYYNERYHVVKDYVLKDKKGKSLRMEAPRYIAGDCIHEVVYNRIMQSMIVDKSTLNDFYNKYKFVEDLYSINEEVGSLAIRAISSNKIPIAAYKNVFNEFYNVRNSKDGLIKTKLKYNLRVDKEELTDYLLNKVNADKVLRSFVYIVENPIFGKYNWCRGKSTYDFVRCFISVSTNREKFGNIKNIVNTYKEVLMWIALYSIVNNRDFRKLGVSAKQVKPSKLALTQDGRVDCLFTFEK